MIETGNVTNRKEQSLQQPIMEPRRLFSSVFFFCFFVVMLTCCVSPLGHKALFVPFNTFVHVASLANDEAA